MDRSGPDILGTATVPMECCMSWYLAIDAHGWPYPIAKDEFEAIYKPV